MAVGAEKQKEIILSSGGDLRSADAEKNGAQAQWQNLASDFWSSGSAMDKARRQTLASGSNPQDALVKAAQANRIIGVGDIHGPLGQQTAALAQQMPELKKAGITDLALEIPERFQNHIDRWNSNDQEFLRQRLKDKSALINLIDSAKAAGVKVSAVDEFYTADGEKLSSRDRRMANNIAKILSDENSKVAFFVGAEHLQNGVRQDSFAPSAAELLRQKNYAIPTFYPQIASAQDALMPVARSLSTPLNLNRANYGEIASLKNAAGTTYDKWDNVVIYPPHYKMETVEAELEQFGKNPAEQLEAAIGKNKVVLLGEMSQAVPEDEKKSAHRQFMLAALPHLKQAGLTDIAVDMPKNYQSALDDKTSPLPGSYDQKDFRAVMAEATRLGLKLHAIGENNESLLNLKEVIDGIARSAEQLASSGNNTKLLVWCREEKVAKFQDGDQEVSLAASLSARNISAKTFASFSQDFTEPTLGLVTEIVPKALSFDPSQTKHLREVPNTFGMQMDRFENVIVYPSQPD